MTFVPWFYFHDSLTLNGKSNVAEVIKVTSLVDFEIIKSDTIWVGPT